MRQRAGSFACVVLGALALGACGARSALDLLVPDDGGSTDAEPDGRTPDGASSPDSGPRPDAAAPVDASAPDVSPLPDAPADTADVVPEDVPPPIDGLLPPDAASCGDSGGAVAYLASDQGQLYTLDPPTLATNLLGTPQCPSGGTTPYAMSVSRENVAYILYLDFNIYAVDLGTLACTRTPYTAGQLGIVGDLGLAVSRGATESLFYYAENTQPILATSDLSTFVLSEVGPITPNPGDFPLDTQFDEFGRLFGLSDTGLFVQVDPSTGSVLGQDQTTLPPAAGGWALLTYQDQVYFFAGSPANEYLYDVATKTLTNMGALGFVVVGASSPPCQ
jgi:hypothetical protein